MTVIVKHNKTNTITDWTQAQLNEQIALGNFPSGTTLANIVLPSDWNNDHTLTGLGTMAEQDATAVAITGGTINNTTIGATTATTGKFTSVTTPSVTATTTDLTLSAISTGVVKVNTAGGLQFQVNNRASSDIYFAAQGGVGGVSRPSFGTLLAGANAAGLNIYNSGNQPIRFQTGGNQVDEQFIVFPTASAVNYVQVTGGATTAAPVISSQGSDGNIALSFVSKGTARHNFFNNGATSSRQFAVGTSGITSAVNFLNVDGSVAGIALPMQAQGTDTNISMAFQPKGTGAIDLAAGSKGVNISNGGTVTAITRTATGSGYTSIPSVAVSAPTTAGGVQAVVTQASMAVGAVAINNGGTGYTVGNTLTVTGGTGGNCTITVSTVSSGVITGITFATTAPYTVLPTNPVSVTGGSGSSATFNLTYGISGTFTITNAGSGYIEQPTITFSGGGGSGAAAYARVGSATRFQTLGGSLDTYTPGGIAFQIADIGVATTDYTQMYGGQGGSYVGVAGSSANPSLYLSSKGTGSVQLFTNGQGNTRQFQASHTASAVNYVQVTGAATSGSPIISSQGSDANTPLVVQSKGTGSLFVKTIGSNAQVILQSNSLDVARFNASGSAVNYFQLTSSAATFSPALSVAGSDTNIDLALTPKGTGRVKYGTHTATADTAVSGYIEIVDAGGTVRKLAVIT
jgi:hypothetical protein